MIERQLTPIQRQLVLHAVPCRLRKDFGEESWLLRSLHMHSGQQWMHVIKYNVKLGACYVEPGGDRNMMDHHD
ncbi:hypothetical protein COCOBI_08-4970 [Coccomyxa sp. Obi]|nr:hypothetical protein COCOBI_08-4970 [Coccomyxa sp. Obi]